MKGAETLFKNTIGFAANRLPFFQSGKECVRQERIDQNDALEPERPSANAVVLFAREPCNQHMAVE